MFSLWNVYRYQSISHSVLWFSLWDVYRYQLISHSSSRLSTMYETIISCQLVQWKRCSSKGSHLIHRTSAVFPHIALKWTPIAYLVNCSCIFNYSLTGSQSSASHKLFAIPRRRHINQVRELLWRHTASEVILLFRGITAPLTAPLLDAAAAGDHLRHTCILVKYRTRITNLWLKLGHRLRLWPNFKTTSKRNVQPMLG